MTPQQFIAKWGPGGPAFKLNEEQGAQSHFIDLCDLLDVPRPGSEEGYLFEQGGRIAGQSSGYADVYKRGAFAWENKAPGKNLDAALRQLLGYTLALSNPPLLIVCDRLSIRIHTQFNGHPSERHEVALHDLLNKDRRDFLRRVWTAPESFRPRTTNRDITEEAAQSFAALAESLRSRGNHPDDVAHFLTQCLFCCFAEDVGLLPGQLFDRLINARSMAPERLRTSLSNLFEAMRSGGLFGVDDVPWFNGGLFQRVVVPELNEKDVAELRNAAGKNWSAIDVSIFGTLFERGLDPSKRSQLGAHYTDPATIERLIDPIIRRPLLREWSAARSQIASKLEKSKRREDKAWRDALALHVGFLQRLSAYRVLDPACGSGNFLFLALKCLKDVEHIVNTDAEALGLDRQVELATGPANVLGIELNEYAAELARVTVWIGELQWRLEHGYPFKTNPVLEPLDHIECRDALIDNRGEAGAMASWPAADSIVGNPPFLGVSRKRGELGESYTRMLDELYAPNIPGAADLVCYWFEKARKQIESGEVRAAGLVATNSIRGGANRKVLDSIVATSKIFEAWSDEPWINEGAAVRVSLICFGDGEGMQLNGKHVPQIYADLTAPSVAGDSLNLSMARPIAENSNASFQGASKKAKFEIDAELARKWLRLPNPNGRPNSDVLKPWANGFELSRRPQEQWIVDFGIEMPEADASLYEAPFAYVSAVVKPERMKNNREAYRRYWWRFAEPRPGLRAALQALPRFIATIAHSKHRFFVWLPITTSPDQALITVARADDTTFGLLHSRMHEVWSLRMGTSLEDRPRYTPTTCFETFPFPAGLSPADTVESCVRSSSVGDVTVPARSATGSGADLAVRIASAAVRLNALRDAWLNPTEWTRRIDEVTPVGLSRSPYPQRLIARDDLSADEIKSLQQRTLTSLYNQRPAWLTSAHRELDAAVAAAYGWSDWSDAMEDDEILRRLLALNLERTGGAGA